MKARPIRRSRWTPGHVALIVLTCLGCRPGYRLPGYANRDSIREIEVTVGQEWPLPGVLTCPIDKTPHPVLILVGGSGKADRNSSGRSSNRPFQDIAWGLASGGVCALRYDKRLLVHSKRLGEEKKETYTLLDDTIDDALAAVALMEERPEVRSDQIFVLGHSLGGYAIPRIAALTKQPCGFVAMASTLRPIEELYVEQARRFANFDGEVTPEEAEGIQETERTVQRVRNLRVGDKVDRRGLPFGLPASFWLDLKTHPAAVYANRLRRPTLVLQGERDILVTPDEVNVWRKHLSGNPDATFKVYPHLNHGFIRMTENTKGNMPHGNVHEQVIIDLRQWIKDRARGCPPVRKEAAL